PSGELEERLLVALFWLSIYPKYGNINLFEFPYAICDIVGESYWVNFRILLPSESCWSLRMPSAFIKLCSCARVGSLQSPLGYTLLQGSIVWGSQYSVACGLV